MNVQEIHERFDTWEVDVEKGEVVLHDKKLKELHRIDIGHLIDLWFEKEDEDGY